MSIARLYLSTRLQTVEHRFLGRSRGNAVTDDSELNIERPQSGLQSRLPLMTEGQHDGIGVLDLRDCAIRGVLEIGHCGIDTDETGISCHLNAELVQFSHPLIAQVGLQRLTDHRAAREIPDPMTVGSDFLSKSNADPVAAKIGDNHGRAQLLLAFQHLPRINDVSRFLALD